MARAGSSVGAPPDRCPPNCRWTPWKWRCGPAAATATTRRVSCTTATVSMWGPVFLGFLTRTAMDATGCWYQEAPGLPDPHFRLTNAVLPRDLSVAREHLVRRLASPTV